MEGQVSSQDQASSCWLSYDPTGGGPRYTRVETTTCSRYHCAEHLYCQYPIRLKHNISKFHLSLQSTYRSLPEYLSMTRSPRPFKSLSYNRSLINSATSSTKSKIRRQSSYQNREIGARPTTTSWRKCLRTSAVTVWSTLNLRQMTAVPRLSLFSLVGILTLHQLDRKWFILGRRRRWSLRLLGLESILTPLIIRNLTSRLLFYQWWKNLLEKEKRGKKHFTQGGSLFREDMRECCPFMIKNCSRWLCLAQMRCVS